MPLPTPRHRSVVSFGRASGLSPHPWTGYHAMPTVIQPDNHTTRAVEGAIKKRQPGAEEQWVLTGWRGVLPLSHQRQAETGQRCGDRPTEKIPPRPARVKPKILARRGRLYPCKSAPAFAGARCADLCIGKKSPAGPFATPAAMRPAGATCDQRPRRGRVAYFSASDSHCRCTSSRSESSSRSIRAWSIVLFMSWAVFS